MIRDQLAVFRRILNFIPLSVHPAAEVPVAGGPGTHRSDDGDGLLEARTEFLSGSQVPVVSSVHHVTETGDADAMGKARASRRESPGFWKGVGHVSPEKAKAINHRVRA